MAGHTGTGPPVPKHTPLKKPPKPAGTPPTPSPTTGSIFDSAIRAEMVGIRADVLKIPATEQQAHMLAIDALQEVYNRFGGDPGVMFDVVDKFRVIQADVKGELLKIDARKYDDYTTEDLEIDLQVREQGGIGAAIAGGLPGLPLKPEEADYIREAHRTRLDQRAEQILRDYKEGRVDQAGAVAQTGGNTELLDIISPQLAVATRAEDVLTPAPGGILNAADMVARLTNPTIMPEFAGLPQGVQDAMKDVINARFGPDAMASLRRMDAAKSDEENAKIRQKEWDNTVLQLKRGWKVGKIVLAGAGVITLIGSGVGAGLLVNSTLTSVLTGGIAFGAGSIYLGKLGFNALGEWDKFEEELAKNRQVIELAKQNLEKLKGEDPLRRLEMMQQFADIAAGVYIDANSGANLDRDEVLQAFQSRALGGTALQGVLNNLKAQNAFNFNYATTPAAPAAPAAA